MFREPNSRPGFLGEAVAAASGEVHDWHSHDFGQLISATAGSMYVGTRSHVLLLSRALAIWIPPGAEHWMRTSAMNEMLYVDVNRDEAQHLGADCRVLEMTPLLGALMTATLPDAGNGRAAEHTRTLHALLKQEFLAARDVPMSVTMPQDQRVQNIAMRALDDPAAFPSVNNWLAGAAASRKTVERLFLRETGMPPLRWLRHVRVLHAISRLADGEKIASVALDMGYESASAFSFMFRQVLGVSPSHFACTPKPTRRAKLRDC
ncbi:MAG: AraC family transcriptional regulator [Nitrospiraceae bacterium]|nr:AraC family transcriptional regulator [Nitrospiraceae bacterium]